MRSLEILETIKTKLADKLVKSEMGFDCPVFYLTKENVVSFMKAIKDDSELAFDLITDITAIDYQFRKPRFEMVYHIFSLKNAERIRVKVAVDEGAAVESVTAVWRGAEWLEREVYDMFGISFDGHPDLRRILMDDDFKHHPLRKDFPLQGYEE